MSAGNFLRSFDRGNQIGVNYRGSDRYKTCAGSLITALLFGLVLVSAIYLISETSAESEGSVVSQYTILADSETSTNISELGGNFGFGLLNFTSGEYYDVFTPGFERFASFEVRQVQGVQFSEPLGLEPCATENMVCIADFD